jgi:hypothetical protein
MFFPTSMIALMVTFRTFSFLHFLADLQKSISVSSNLFASCVFSVHVSAPYSRILWTKAWYIIFIGFVKEIVIFMYKNVKYTDLKITPRFRAM